MTITIHYTAGGFSCHEGIEGHIDAERILARMGYTIHAAAIPAGLYGDGDLYAVRSATSEYAEGEYDVAEVDA